MLDGNNVPGKGRVWRGRRMEGRREEAPKPRIIARKLGEMEGGRKIFLLCSMSREKMLTRKKCVSVFGNASCSRASVLIYAGQLVWWLNFDFFWLMHTGCDALLV